MALYHKWDLKNDFAYVLQFFSIVSDGLGRLWRDDVGFWTIFSLVYLQTHTRNFANVIRIIRIIKALNDWFLGMICWNSLFQWIWRQWVTKVVEALGSYNLMKWIISSWLFTKLYDFLFCVTLKDNTKLRFLLISWSSKNGN